MALDIFTFSRLAGGQAEFGTETINLTSHSSSFPGGSALVSQRFASTGHYFVELPPGFSKSKDFSVRRQLCVLVAGKVEIASGSGDKKVFTVGDVLRFEDTDYKAPNRSISVIGDEPARMLVVQLE